MLRLEKAAAKSFAKLDPREYAQAWEALLNLCATSAGDVVPIVGYANGSLRLRVGDNRVLLSRAAKRQLLDDDTTPQDAAQ